MTSSSTQSIVGEGATEETALHPANQVLDDIFGAYVEVPAVEFRDPEEWTRGILDALNNPIRTEVPSGVGLSLRGPEATRSGFQTKSDFVMQGSTAL